MLNYVFYLLESLEICYWKDEFCSSCELLGFVVGESKRDTAIVQSHSLILSNGHLYNSLTVISQHGN